MYINGFWGTVCKHDWSAMSSVVMCKQLGLGNTGTSNSYGSGSASNPIHFDSVMCNGSEPNILSCPHPRIGIVLGYCRHRDDVGVTCSGLYG